MQRDYRAVFYRGKWAIEWYENGKRFRKSLGDTQRIGIPLAVERLKAEHDARDKPEVITVKFAWESFRASLGDRPSGLSMGYESKAVLAHFGDMRADAVTEEDCDAYTAARRKLGRSNGTTWTELGHLRSALKWAERKNLIAKAPAIKRPERPPPRDKRMTREQARRFIEKCEKPHVKLFVRLALATAARMRAILDLTWDRVDFEAGVIRLHNPEKGKTSKGRALVPMHDQIAGVLREAKEGATGNWVIEWGGHKVHSVKKGIEAAGRRSGLPWVTAHVFRHSAACWMAESGVPMSEIAQYLGHSSTRITETVYARYSPTYLKNAAKSLEL